MLQTRCSSDLSTLWSQLWLPHEFSLECQLGDEICRQKSSSPTYAPHALQPRFDFTGDPISQATSTANALAVIN